jgi:hypothetical protein
MGNCTSPSVRCDYPSCTSAVYSHSCISTVRSYTQYKLSSILQFFLHTRCFHTGTKYLRTFSVAMSKLDTTTRLHCSQLPPEPNPVRNLHMHPFRQYFLKAVELKYQRIWNKGCFTKIAKTESTADGEVLPLLWVFTYKFNEDGYLYKYKARLVVRSDLQQTPDNTYAATLAARTFWAMTALANHFRLEMMQYNAPNAFLNVVRSMG